MKVLIISPNKEQEPYPVAPIGAAYIAAALIEQGHTVSILDLCFEEDAAGAARAAINSYSPDVIGLSIRNIDNLTYGKSIFYMPYLKELVRVIKASTDALIIAGGSGFSIFPEEVLLYLGINYGIVGEGEAAMVQFLDCIQKKTDFNPIPNFCSLENGFFWMNKAACSYSFARPERSLLDNKRYMLLGGMGNIQAKRGCPFQCTYCTYPEIEGKELRMREPADIAAEIKEANRKFGIDYFFFVDDIFNFPEHHAAAICEEMIRIEARVEWTCFATPLGMSEELARLMKAAGCRGVEFGSDAGADMTIEAFEKPFSQQDIIRASESCRSVDLPDAHYIIMGGPGEDSATISETFELFDHVSPKAAIAMTGVRIYPNTGLHQRAVQEGVISDNTRLFEPVFYISKGINSSDMMRTIEAEASARRNWIVPSLDIRCDASIISLLRRSGKKGPLWDLL